MAVLLPSLGACPEAMTPGERRVAQRLRDKLGEDHWVWYELSIARSRSRPDFVVFSPNRGLLVLEVKDWSIDRISEVSQATAKVRRQDGTTYTDKNPLQQAHEAKLLLVRLLQKESCLCEPPTSKFAGKLCFPWDSAAVFPNITRRQLEGLQEVEALDPTRVLCRDELVESLDPATFEERLWSLAKYPLHHPLSSGQVDSLRARIYPEIRVDALGQASLALDEPGDRGGMDLVRVMDRAQEVLARSLGNGHRVIHGVAGSGKTMVLVFRCRDLARVAKTPILVLCYNVSLATRLEHLLCSGDGAGKVIVRSFHQWCRELCVEAGLRLPTSSGDTYVRELFELFMSGVESGKIADQRYSAVLIDEGHDFEADWLRCAVRMVDPQEDRLLLLYDDAQALYPRSRKDFSFKSVGIRAQGRTTVLRTNYRNTLQILELAYHFARDVLQPSEADDDAIPLIEPESADRSGPIPLLLNLRDKEHELTEIAKWLRLQYEEGIAWRDMAVLCRARAVGDAVHDALTAADLPNEWVNATKKSRRYDPAQNSVKILTMHASKGLEFTAVAIPALGELPYAKQDLAEQVRLLYVAMTRAMDRLLVTFSTDSDFVRRMTRDVEADRISGLRSA